MKKHGKSMTKSLAKPTRVFKKSPKKPEDDDTPGRMKGGPSHVPRPAGAKPSLAKHRKLKSMMI